MRLALIKTLAFTALTASLLLIGSESHAETTDAGDYPAFLFITSPADGATYEAPTAIDVSVSVSQGTYEYITDVDLYVDGVLVATKNCEWDCTFLGIELGEGEHIIEATAPADDDFVTVTVGEDAGSGGESGGESGGDEAGSGDSNGDPDDGSIDDEDIPDLDEDALAGRGCDASGDPLSPFGLLALPALLLLGLRRRERSA